MSVAGGLNSQLGLAEETTPGTALTPTRFIEFDSESLTNTIERIEHSGLRPTRRVLGNENWAVGRQSVAGDVNLMLQNKGCAFLFKHALGTVATTTPGGATLSRQHKCTVGPTDGKALTVQVGRTDVTGTTRAFTYAGCKVASWELSNVQNELLGLKLSLDGVSETTATALASASYATGLSPFVYTQGIVNVAGSAFDLKDWSVQANNALATDRYFIRSTTPGQKKEQLEGAGLREYTGTLTADFTDLTAYNRFINGTTAALQMVYTAGSIESGFSYKIQVDLPCVRFDGATPNVTGPALFDLSLPFKVVDNQDTDGPVVVTIINTDTTA